MNILQALAMMRRTQLRMPSAKEDLAALRPAVIPAAWLDGSSWIPGFRLPAGELALAWMLKRDLPTYVAGERAAEWEAAGIEWQRQAFRNLRAGEAGIVDEVRGGNGRLQWLSIRGEDGSGGARVLLQEQLAEKFPGGYRLAVPEPATGFAVCVALEGGALAEVLASIQASYKRAETPVSAGLWTPADLAVPATWLQ